MTIFLAAVALVSTVAPFVVGYALKRCERRASLVDYWTEKAGEQFMCSENLRAAGRHVLSDVACETGWRFVARAMKIEETPWWGMREVELEPTNAHILGKSELSR